ncbi:MAG: hypothetical protein ACE5OP_09960 [Candidatus Glassbacteria bacterium]
MKRKLSGLLARCAARTIKLFYREMTGEEKEVRAPAHWKRKWAELLRLVFDVSLACPRCGTEMKILSFVTESEPIGKILAHLKQKGTCARAGPFAGSAA